MRTGAAPGAVTGAVTGGRAAHTGMFPGEEAARYIFHEGRFVRSGRISGGFAVS